MKIETSGESMSGKSILDALKGTCNEQIDGFLRNVEWRRFMGRNLLGFRNENCYLGRWFSNYRSRLGH